MAKLSTNAVWDNTEPDFAQPPPFKFISKLNYAISGWYELSRVLLRRMNLIARHLTMLTIIQQVARGEEIETITL